MGNLNFQDGSNENPQGNQPEPSSENDSKLDDVLIDDPMSNSKTVWIAVVVVLIAVIGGALYMLNRAGYLKFSGKQKSAITTLASPPPSAQPVAESPKATEPAKATNIAADKFALQVSAFRSKTEADKFVAKLGKKGISARVVHSTSGADRKWYRVYSGSFDTKLKAIAAIEDMKKKVGTDVWVVPAQ